MIIDKIVISNEMAERIAKQSDEWTIKMLRNYFNEIITNETALDFAKEKKKQGYEFFLLLFGLEQYIKYKGKEVYRIKYKEEK